MATIRFTEFSDDDLRLLREIIRDKGTTRENSPSHSPDQAYWNGTDDYPAPDLYLGKPVDAAGIPAIEPAQGAFHEKPGQALCNIYRIIPKRSPSASGEQEPEIVDTGLVKWVYNISPIVVTRANYFPVSRLKSGKWLALFPMQGLTRLKSVERSVVLGPRNSGGIQFVGSCCIVLPDGSVDTDHVYQMDLTSCSGLVFPLTSAEEVGSSSILDISPEKTCYGVYDGDLDKFIVYGGGTPIISGVMTTPDMSAYNMTPVLEANDLRVLIACSEIVPSGTSVRAHLVDGTTLEVFARCC